MANNRYVGDYPVIGIRPIVDGRRGPMMLRESLEPIVWAMANAAKKLFEENLYYSNGEHVKVVMADTCIGRVPEAAACANKFKKEGVDITLSVTPCWCYGSETMDMDPTTIKGVWGFNGTERPGAVYLAAVLAGHAQKVMRFRIATRFLRSPRTLKRSCCASAAPLWLLQLCGVSPICKSALSVWVLPALSSTRTLWSPIWVCG